MKEILLTAPTGEVFVLNSKGEYYIHTYNQNVISVHEAGKRIRHWIQTEGWMGVFEKDWYPLTVEDFTNLPERI